MVQRLYSPILECDGGVRLKVGPNRCARMQDSSLMVHDEKIVKGIDLK